MKNEKVQPSPAVAVPDHRQQLAESMARTLLWIAHVWNDHNFQHDPKHYAQQCAVKLGIGDFDKANDWLEGSLSTPTPPSAEKSNPWHEAVLHECMMTEACYVESDPMQSVKNLIDWHIDNTEVHLHNQNQSLLLKIPELEQPDSANGNDVMYLMPTGEFFNGHATYTGHVQKPDNFVDESIANHKIYLERPTKPQRITEQDARRIITCAFSEIYMDVDSDILDDFFVGVGKILLTSINEHREPDYRAQRDELLQALKHVRSNVCHLSYARSAIDEAIAKASASTEVKNETN